MNCFEAKTKIWIIGSDLFMDGIAAYLEHRSIPNIIHMDTLSAELTNAILDTSRPILIFELETPDSDALMKLLKKKPGINLIGIHQKNNQMILFSSTKTAIRSMDDLYQILQKITGVEIRDRSKEVPTR